MKSRRRRLRGSYLYVIIDKEILEKKNLISVAKSVVEGGVDIIQFRNKISEDSEFLREAKRLRIITQNKETLFIIDDRPDIAKAVDADGVHLGRGDLPIRIARKMLGENRLIGFSCHSLKDILLAERLDVDYISIGPVFKTPLKPKNRPVGLHLFRNLEERIKIPVFAVGGINFKNLKGILKKGIKRIAICRGILLKRNITEVTKRIKSVLIGA